MAYHEEISTPAVLAACLLLTAVVYLCNRAHFHLPANPRVFTLEPETPPSSDQQDGQRPRKLWIDKFPLHKVPPEEEKEEELNQAVWELSLDEQEMKHHFPCQEDWEDGHLMGQATLVDVERETRWKPRHLMRKPTLTCIPQDAAQEDAAQKDATQE